MPISLPGPGTLAVHSVPMPDLGTPCQALLAPSGDSVLAVRMWISQGAALPAHKT